MNYNINKLKIYDIYNDQSQGMLRELYEIFKNKNYEKCFKYNFWLFYIKPLDIDTIVSYC